MDGGLQIGHVEEHDWKMYLRSTMRVIGDERELYFVFSLSHLSPAFWVLAFGYVLSSAFLRSLPNLRTSCLAGLCQHMLRWHKVYQHALCRYGVKYDNCYVTEHR